MRRKGTKPPRGYSSAPLPAPVFVSLMWPLPSPRITSPLSFGVVRMSSPLVPYPPTAPIVLPILHRKRNVFARNKRRNVDVWPENVKYGKCYRCTSFPDSRQLYRHLCRVVVRLWRKGISRRPRRSSKMGIPPWLPFHPSSLSCPRVLATMRRLHRPLPRGGGGDLFPFLLLVPRRCRRIFPRRSNCCCWGRPHVKMGFVCAANNCGSISNAGGQRSAPLSLLPHAWRPTGKKSRRHSTSLLWGAPRFEDDVRERRRGWGAAGKVL